MNNPFLSIITINFNNAEGLQKTMDSVLGQTFTDFEYIIIDGGSQDHSVDVIKPQVDRISYWVSEKDKGVFHAQNKGIKVAKGKYLLFLNSGDVLNGKNALDEFVSHKEFQGDIIYGDYKYDEGEKVYPDELSPAYFMKTSLPHQSTLFHRRVFDIMGLYDESYQIAADRAFYISCYLNESISFKHVPYFLSIFDRSGLSNDPIFFEKKKKEDELIFRRFYGEKYDEYKSEIELEKKRNRAKRKSLTGILKRIKKRLSF